MKTYIKPSLILVVLIVLGGFVYVGAQSNQNNFNQGTGSGSGTVSANSGSANTVAGYSAAGGSTTVGPFAGLTYSLPTLTVSAAGSGNGIVALSGNTSGTATITAPATAGTSTNAIAFSNVISAPAGALNNVAYQLSSTASWGMWADAPNSSIGFQVLGAGVENAALSGTGGFTSFYVGSAHSIGFAPNASTSSAGPDTKINRLAAGIFQFSDGTAGDEAGLLRWNTCRITADVSLTVNTANSFCSWNLPAVAKAWSFRCDVQWAITAGSGTNNFALGVNPSQTPTGTTNAEAQIYTAAPANTSTMASAAISASGATTILTGATYTPAATVQFATISGTLLASGTAGTFAIQATANGTTATAAVKAGSSCQIF